MSREMGYLRYISAIAGNSAVSAKPMRVFTETRIGQAAKISARMPSSAARSRSIPEPLCLETTVPDGQPTLRFISS